MSPARALCLVALLATPAAVAQPLPQAPVSRSSTSQVIWSVS